MKYNSVIRQVLSNFKIFKSFEIMSFITPKFYDTKSYYQLIVSITKCEKLSDSEKRLSKLKENLLAWEEGRSSPSLLSWPHISLHRDNNSYIWPACRTD